MSQSQLKLIDQRSVCSTKHMINEDRLFAQPPLLFVIDGCSDVGTPEIAQRLYSEKDTGASWYAQKLVEKLSTQRHNFSENPHDYIAAVSSSIRNDFLTLCNKNNIDFDTLPFWEYPSATLIWTELFPEQNILRIISVGDGLALIRRNGNIQIITNELPKPRAAELAKMKEDSFKKSGDASHERNWDYYRASRAAFVESGWCRISLLPDRLPSLRVIDLPADPGTEILLCSDGLYRLVNGYGIDTPNSLMEEGFREGCLDSLLKKLRSYEEGHRNEIGKSESKSDDDTTGILAKIVHA